MGDYEKAAPWSEDSVKGCKRFIDRVWNLQTILNDSEEYSKKLEAPFNRAIKKVSSDIETLKYNTAIAALMTLLNEIYEAGSITRKELKTFISLLNPFAPHVTEEINEILGSDTLLAVTEWPAYDEAKCVDSEIEIAVQVNGKVRAKIMIPAECTQEEALAAAKADEKIAAEMEGKTVIKELYVKGRLVNIVVK